jgi:hypothetical protein
MILVSQNCLAGHLYKILNLEYACPFIWTVIDFQSMKILITEWDKLDFLDYDIVKDSNWNFSIIIDKRVKIQFVHYKFNPKTTTLTKTKNGDIFYNKIWVYIVEKYEERVKRMLSQKCKPLFCIANFDTIYKDALYTDEQLLELSRYDNVKILRGVESNTPYEAALKFFNLYLR